MPGKLHQTTIRFAADTWLKIEQRASANGVSAAQYVRDATVARIAVELAEIAAQEAQREEPSDGRASLRIGLAPPNVRASDYR